MIDIFEIFFEGDRVKTSEAKHDDLYTPEARENRKWGVMGTVIEQHNSHGLNYKIRHDDGSIAVMI